MALYAFVYIIIFLKKQLQFRLQNNLDMKKKHCKTNDKMLKKQLLYCIKNKYREKSVLPETRKTV